MPADPQRRPSKDLQAVYGSVPDDLSRLPSLEEDRVRDALKQRFEAEQIYTHINALLGQPHSLPLHRSLAHTAATFFKRARQTFKPLPPRARACLSRLPLPPLWQSR